MPKSKNINMLEGPLLKNITLYTLPVIATGVLQLLFNAADLIVVGQYCGSNSVAAVGACNALINLLVNIFIGLSSGAGVTVANFLGAKDYKSVHKTVHSAVLLALIGGAILTVVGYFLAPNMLLLMNTPKSILPLSTTYVRIYFLGVIPLVLYNFAAAILRAAGDTKRPLIFLATAGIINVILNVIFVRFFGLNVAGVALATTISQCISCILVVVALIKRTDAVKLTVKKLRFYKHTVKRIIGIGLPAGIQSSLFSISNIIIQTAVNGFGESVISGSAASASIEGFVYIIMNAYYHAALNFVGQNDGANNIKRVKEVARVALLSVTAVGIVTGVATYLCRMPLLSIYIVDNPAAVEAGCTKLLLVCFPYFLCGILDTITGVIRGLGVSFRPMIIAIGGICVFRIVFIFTVFQIYHTFFCLLLAYPLSWIISFIAQYTLYRKILCKRTALGHPLTSK